MNTPSNHVKIIALSSLFLATGSQAYSIFQEFQDMFDEMHARQKALLNAIEKETAIHESKKQAKFSIKIEEDTDASHIKISVTGISINGDKPDATFEAESETRLMKLEIPLNFGRIEINTQDSFVSVSCQQKETAEQESSSRVFARTYNQARVMNLKPDMQAMPKISYDKESKTLTVTLACQPSARTQNKKAIAIDVK